MQYSEKILKGIRKHSFVIKVSFLIFAIVVTGILGLTRPFTGSESKSGTEILPANGVAEIKANGASPAGKENDADMHNAEADCTGTNTDSRTMKIVVYVCGEVYKPDIYEMQQGQRVKDAIDAAGGATDEADLNGLNLADFLSDGQKIYVLRGTENASDGDGGMDGLNAAGGDDEATSDAGSAMLQQRININTATKSELMELPGIGETRAQDIIQYRKEHGAFATIEDIKKVPGIKDGAYLKIKPRIKV